MNSSCLSTKNSNPKLFGVWKTLLRRASSNSNLFPNFKLQPNLADSWLTLRRHSTDMEEVTLIASGYDWWCKTCEALNKETACPDTVTCSNCGASFKTAPPEHAFE